VRVDHGDCGGGGNHRLDRVAAFTHDGQGRLGCEMVQGDPR
jgi:hypothetical protein